MIHALDHIVVAAGSLEAAVADYEVLLGRRANRPAHSGGVGRASIQLANVRLDLVAGAAGAADGLSALGFAVADLTKAQALLQRRALRPARADGEPVLQIATEAAHGVAVGLVEHAPRREPSLRRRQRASRMRR